ncbi:hypothetical protein G9A89_023352 [Geosiphon pyriformis]|nr:hypothetical protein G9A89_023352 [Geosiphon pyriformis]
MNLKTALGSDMSKKKVSKSAFHGPVGGFFTQKKKVVLENVKHSGNEKDISLSKFGLGNSVYFNVNSLFGNNENVGITGINGESLLGSATTTPKMKCINTGTVFGSPLDSSDFTMDDNDIWIDPKIIKIPVEVSVRKFFTLDINFLVVDNKSATAKTQFIRKIFSSVNGFGGTTISLKFEEIIRSIFTSENSMDSIKTFRYNTCRTTSPEVAFEHQVTGLLFTLTAEISPRTSINKYHSKVAESENIGANHLGFAKFLFQHYCQYLRLNHNHISAKSAFNFYINKKISSLLETPVNTESARETFYKELIQNTNLPTNHNFTSIITEINKEIEHHTQQRYPIIYASKGKGKLQTPAVTPRKIQPPTWKKNRIESPSNLSYHYTPGSAINISSTDAFPSTVTSAFERFPFQSRQKKTELLGSYSKYFERFNLQSSTPLGLRSPPSLPDFGISNPWEAAESEKEKEESEDQEFIYQHPITKNPEVETPNFQIQQNLNLENSEIKTLNHQRQNNPNSELINQQNLPPLLQLPPQQPVQQQLLQQPPQPPNLDPMAYTPITKLDNFTGEEDDTQKRPSQLMDEMTLKQYKPFSTFSRIPLIHNIKAWLINHKISMPSNNNNNINCLVNTFTTIKQGETEVILNQFIHGLRSSILQHICPLHPGTFQDAVTRIRDFESAESEANHAQAINLVMNRSSELDSKLEKFTTVTGNVSITTANNLSTPNDSDPTTKLTGQWSPKAKNHAAKLEIIDGTENPQNLNSQNYLSLLVTPENALTNNPAFAQKQPLTSNIPPATITENKFLAAIFPFKLKELSNMLLFSGAILEEKSITTIYTDAKIDDHHIKLILDSSSAGNIITRQLMDQLGHRVDRAASARIITADGATKTPISKIDDFSFKVNGIVTPIKVLVIKATQYQALVGNNWLSKVNVTLD